MGIRRKCNGVMGGRNGWMECLKETLVGVISGVSGPQRFYDHHRERLLTDMRRFFVTREIEHCSCNNMTFPGTPVTIVTSSCHANRTGNWYGRIAMETIVLVVFGIMVVDIPVVSEYTTRSYSEALQLTTYNEIATL